MKVLNLDSYVVPTRELKFKGVSYPINELNVEQFIENLKAGEDLEAAQSEGTPGSERARQFSELSFKAIASSVPTFPDAEMRSLPMPTLTLILEFIRGEFDPDALAAPAAPNEKEGADPEKKPD